MVTAGVLGYVGFRMVTTYRDVGREFTTRITAFETSPPGTVVKIDPYSRKRSRWFLGEDLDYWILRGLVGDGFRIKIEMPGAPPPPAQESTPPPPTSADP